MPFEVYDEKTGITVSTIKTFDPNDHATVYRRGAARSVARLRSLEFDPIGELVAQYRKLQDELKRQEDIRANRIVELRADGKPKSYRVDIHMGLYDKLREIGKELLRYGYGRVPELNVVTDRVPQPLVVNLARKGEQFVINNEPDEDMNGS
jgi:hypothetical protein